MQITFNQLRVTFALLSCLAVALSMQSCKQNQEKAGAEEVDMQQAGLIEIVTENMEFQAPDTIPSGWTTWRYDNRSEQPHFILIDDYVDSITIKEFRDELLPPFGEGITKMYQGKMEEANEAFGKIPEWFSGTVWPGGVGLISPGHTAETTLKLEPGFYIMECYVKMVNGMFHTNMGMYKGFVVSEEMSDMEEPSADVTIDISSENGISVVPPVEPGTYTFSVNYIDQTKYANFQGHDINLVRIDDGADLKVLENWMNWMNLDGLIDPVPEGFTFLGGVNDMPAGSKGYFKARLQPGTYALISEVPEASGKNMLYTFVIQ